MCSFSLRTVRFSANMTMLHVFSGEMFVGIKNGTHIATRFKTRIIPKADRK
ncbi:MAG: hypothetical protein ACI8PB_002452 [Desulforhopalus sp.]|jgi:hypothetical protein